MKFFVECLIAGAALGLAINRASRGDKTLARIAFACSAAWTFAAACSWMVA